MSDPDREAAICARIKQARVEAGLGHREFAERIGVSGRAIYNYESNRVPWKLIDRIAAVTPRTSEWLLHGDDGMNPDLARVERRLDRIEGLLADLVEALADGATDEVSRSVAPVPRARADSAPRTRRARAVRAAQ